MSKTHCPDCGAIVPRLPGSGHCPACLLRLSLSVADGGLAFGLEENKGAHRDTTSEAQSKRIRYLGDYELLEEIGRGGMGVVYKARQMSLNRLVALKLVRVGEFADEKEIARFRSEAEAAANLDHPNIVPIYEVGEHEGRHYFSMKLIEGGSLAEPGSRFPISSLGSSSAGSGAEREVRQAKLMATIARAVHYAHQRGLLHRDLKPGNILLNGDGEPHVTDFGLAKRIETDSAMTMPGVIIGTPSYISPEQAAGAKQLTTATDVYSLGAILYELLAGRPPFAGGTVMETLQKVMNEDPVPPSAACTGLKRNATSVDRDLETICLKCLEKEPARRYGSAEAVAEDLERWLRHDPIRARAVTPGERVHKWARRNPILASGSVALFLVGALGLGGILWQWRRAEEAAHQTREELWRSQLLEARSYRLSHAPGQRNRSLEVIAQAAKYRPSVELRNEAIAALVLPDLGSNVWGPGENIPLFPQALTSDLSFFARASGRGGIAVCSAGDRQVISRFGDSIDPPKTMRFSPDDSLLGVKFMNGILRVWRWRDGELLLETQSWSDNSDHFCAFDFTPDGREFWLSDADEQLARYSLPEGRLLPPPPISGKVRRLRFDPSGQRLLGISGQTVTAWDVATGTELRTWNTPSPAWCAAWHPGGDFFALGFHQAGLYVGEIGHSSLMAFDLDAHSKAVWTDLDFTPQGNFLLAGGWGGLLGVWDFATQKQVLRSRAAAFTQLSRDGTQIAGTWERKQFGLRFLHTPTGIRRLRVPTVLGGVTEGMAWHPGGRWLISTHPFGWALWDTIHGQLALQKVSARVCSVQFLPEGVAFLTGGDAGAQLWPFDARKEVPQVGPPRTLTSTRLVPRERANLSPDGKRFAAVGDYAWLGSVTGDSAPIPIVDARGNTSVSFSPDGRWLCISRHKDPNLRIRDAFTGAFVTNIVAGTPDGRFTPAGDKLVSATRDHLTFWRAGTWEKLGEVACGDDKADFALNGFWPDGSCALISGGYENTLRIWNLKANKEIATLWLPAESGAWSTIFDPTGHRMATAAAHPYVDIWDLAALRRELARLGLDWRGEDPSGTFAPRQP